MDKNIIDTIKFSLNKMNKLNNLDSIYCMKSPFEYVPNNKRISSLQLSRYIYNIDTETNKMILNKRYYDIIHLIMHIKLKSD